MVAALGSVLDGPKPNDRPRMHDQSPSHAAEDKVAFQLPATDNKGPSRWDGKRPLMWKQAA
jgi:hypothetical protein